MKSSYLFRLLLCGVVFILLFTSSAFAQYPVFTAKAGLTAARQAANDSGFTGAHLVSIHTVWTAPEGSYELDPYTLQRYWNGLSDVWHYTFFQPEDSSYHAFQLQLVNDNFTIALSELPKNLDTNRIYDGWMNTDVLADSVPVVKNHEELLIQLSFDTYNYRASKLLNRLTWKTTNNSSFRVIDAYTGERITSGAVGIEYSDNRNKGIFLYPNPSSSDVIVKIKNPEFHTLEILTLSGNVLREIAINRETENITIPNYYFPSSGQYYLRLQAQAKTEILPVTICR